MGWSDYHLHQFETKNPKTERKEIIGIPEEMYDGDAIDYKTLPGWKLQVRDYFSEQSRNNALSL